jgi:hypothetical protein
MRETLMAAREGRELCKHPEVCGQTWCNCAGDIPASLDLIADNEARARELSNAHRRERRAQNGRPLGPKQSTLLPAGPRQKPRKLMHVRDAGADDMVQFECARCGYRSRWQQMGMARAKRGIPCPACTPPTRDGAGA